MGAAGSRGSALPTASAGVRWGGSHGSGGPGLKRELRARGQVRFGRFMGRAYAQPSPVVAGFIERQFEPVAARLYPLLERALPAVAPAEVRVRMRLVVAVVTALFAGATPPDRTGPLDTDDLDAQLHILVGFLAPGLKARVSAPSKGDPA